jgi:serine/threonine protein kinase
MDAKSSGIARPQRPEGSFDRLGPYRILKELGKGGMGVVFLAHQESLDRRVALKVILPHLAGNAALMARFKRECQTHSQLEHPNIVRFYDSGEDQGFHYNAMEFLDAVPLDEIIKDTNTTQEFRLAYRVAESMASALAYLHGKGILHRDIKPGNVMIERRTGRVVMMDFGLVKPSDVTRLTREGKTVGSPRYMAPEMLEGKPTDNRTDIYQVGVTLYQLATGKVPFNGQDLTTLAAAILYGRVPPPREVCPLVPIPLQNFILNCMARDKEDRYLSGEEMLLDVKRLRAGLAVRLRIPQEGHPDHDSADISGSGVQYSHSSSVSASGLLSDALHPVSTTTMEITPTSRIPPLLPIMLLLLVVSAIPFFLGGSVSYKAEQVTSVAGIHAVLLTWKGHPSYPSRVAVRPQGSRDPDLSRIFLGDAPEGSEQVHQLKIEPLDPDLDYEACIVFPNGASSLHRALPRAHGGEPRVEHERRYLPNGVELTVRCQPSCKGSLRFRGKDRWEDLSLSNDYASVHTLKLPLPPDLDAWQDTALHLQFVGRKETFPLPPIAGRERRRKDLCERIENLDLEPVLRHLGETLKIVSDEKELQEIVLQTLGLPELEEILRYIRQKGRLSQGTPLDWRTYRALRKLEGVDSWLVSNNYSRALHLTDTYSGLVKTSWPSFPPQGGLQLMKLETGGATSFLPQGKASESSMTVLKVFANSSKIKNLEVFQGSFSLPEAPPSGSRARIALRVRNLHPTYSFRFTLEGQEAVDLFTTPKSFRGYYWAQIRDMEKSAAIAAIEKNSQWILTEFPSALLHKGPNHFQLSARIQDGVVPNHFVDAYTLYLWPKIPSP